MIGLIKPADLPSPPKTALQVLKVCSDESVDFAEISKIVMNDPQLTTEILRMVNSAFYNRSSSVNTLNQAISIIGTKSLRNMCLCLSVKEVFSKDEFDEQLLSDFWTDSIYRAVVAKHLAELFGQDQDECFTAGLLQDFGLLVMIYLNPENASSWNALRQLEPDKRESREKTVFNYTHTEVFQLLGNQWSLPDSIIDSVYHHHQCDTSANKNVCDILNAADWFTYVISAENFQQASDLSKLHIRNTLKLNDEEIEKCFNQISAMVKQAAEGMGIELSQEVDYKNLLQKTNIKLAEDNLDIQELNMQLQQAVAERDRLSNELHEEIKLAAEIQESLLPKDKTIPLFGMNVAAKELSGDFFDYMILKDGCILFCLADVSGKGITASLLMVKTSSLFHCLGKYITDLEKLVSVINDELVETSIRGMFVTFICGRYNPSNNKVELINAGHPAAILMSAESHQTIDAVSIPLGIEKNIKFTKDNFSIKDSLLYLYTDGITESTINNSPIGVVGLIDFIKKIKDENIDKQLKVLTDMLTSDAINSFDDMTMLVVDGR